jgi:hypothetical protein
VAEPDRVQLHLTMPFRLQPGTHPSVRTYLDRGFRIVAVQRLSDREALVTVEAGPLSPSDSSRP